MDEMSIKPSGSLQLVFSLKLPWLHDAAPGPLNTVVSDERGNLYYSDEINHTVVCLDSQGHWVWHRNGPGKKRGEFHYPRGLALGWIRREDRNIKCLGVADAWNHRVQFLDENGNPASLLTAADSLVFSDPSDLRFIPASQAHGNEQHGFWVVLDRGNHRLCVFDTEGNAILQAGRCLIPALSNRWVPPRHVLELEPLDGADLKKFPILDFLYFPSRILGGSAEGLFVWEPLNRSIKYWLLGNLLPVEFPSYAEVDWIAADGSSFLGHSPKTSSLVRVDESGNLLMETGMPGRPVFSDLPPDQIWTQSDDLLQRWALTTGADQGRTRSAGSYAHAVLRHLAETNIRFDMHAAMAEIAELMESVESGVRLIAEFVKKAHQSPISVNQWQDLWSLLLNLEKQQGVKQGALNRSFHQWCVGVLETRLAGICGHDDGLQLLMKEIRATWTLLTEPFRKVLVALQQQLDSFFMLAQIPDDRLPDKSSAKPLREWTSHIEAYLTRTQVWVYSWSGADDSSTEPSFALPEERCDNSFPSIVGRLEFRPYKAFRPCLKEVHRLSMSAYLKEPMPRPSSIVQDANGDLFISLYSHNCILHLNSNGVLVDRIGSPGKNPAEFQGPAGLALDSGGRLWVADSSNNRVQSIDLKERVFRSISGPGKSFAGPLGLCRLQDDSILVTDSGNRRIVRVSADGTPLLFFDGMAERSIEVRYPCTLFASFDGSVWCTDPLSHRVMHFDETGRLLGILGQCGIEKGGLLRPSSVAVFRDGTVVVAQAVLRCILKLFSPEGTEQAAYLADFEPGGMLVRGDQLLVTEWNGDSIRVYERN